MLDRATYVILLFYANQKTAQKYMFYLINFDKV